MSKLAALSSGGGVTAVAGVAVVSAVAAAGYFGGFFTEAPAPDVAPDMAPAQVVAVQPEVTSPAPDQPGTAQAADATEAMAPRFDIVRIESDGSAMIAGAAEAGSSVAIRLDGEVVAQVSADSGGNFASFVSLPPSQAPRVLTLNTQGGAQSEEQVIIAPTVQDAPAPTPAPEQGPQTTAVASAPAESQPTQDLPAQDVIAAGRGDASVPQTSEEALALAPPAQDNTALSASVPPVPPVPLSEAQAGASQQASVQTAQSAEPSQNIDPTVIISSPEGVSVLQAPEAMTSLLGTISYDAAGDVALTGRAQGAFVRVYLDNAPLTASRIEENGDWRVGLPDVATGIYTLRVDELNETGDVVSRVETPFKREAAKTLQAATVTDVPVQAITVQPGATLWAIARERYGSGILYTRLVQANADEIRDPDLIYPGQVFTLPN